jgi:hypothetical protein|tara:strand:+ start:198 stop:461 length:264 start_codon:yes stop_codon:yes gene_type:complete
MNINKFKLNREDVYNDVIQEYSELTFLPKRDKFNHHYDDVQNIISNLVDLVMEFGDDVYTVINLNDYTFSELKDYKYLENQILNYTN